MADFMKTVLITGGSSGLGLELSKHFARDAYRLLWVSKTEAELMAGRKTLLADYPDVPLETMATDLSKEDAADAVFRWSESIAPVDALINNAGFGTYGFLEETSEDTELAMMRLNMQMVYLLTRRFLEVMEKRGRGRIVNISSSTALQPVPRMSTYSATKSFVKQFSESLNEELQYRNSSVSVTAICPAAIGNTNFSKAASMEDVNTFSGLAAATVEEVARDTYRAFQRGQQLMVTGSRMRMVNAIRYWVPSFILKAALKKELDRAT